MRAHKRASVTTTQRILFWVSCCLLFSIQSARGQPSIQLSIPAYEGATFSNFSTLSIPTTEIEELEIILREAKDDIQLSSVRMTLNGQSVSTFLSVNPLPRGVRTILGLGRTLNPAFQLRPEGENILTFEALDHSRNKYHGQFFLVLDNKVDFPKIGSTSTHVVDQPVVEPPPSYSPPKISWPADFPSQVREKVLTLKAEVTDEYGLRRVVIEINGKDVEEIVLENDRPIRKRGGFRLSGKLPGTVSGNGKEMLVSLPVELKKTVNVIAIRAENTMGLRTREDRTIEKPKK